MNIGAILVVGSIISFIVTFAFIIKITDLEFKIDDLKSKLYELEKKIKEYEK